MKRIVVFLGIITVIILILLAAREARQSNTETPEEVVSVPISQSDITPGTYSRTIESDGQTRSYKVHIPTGYDANKATPLVFILHGGMGSGGQILAATEFAKKADAKNFIVVAPDGVDNNWNDGRGTTVQGNTDVVNSDDVAFISNLIEELKTIYSIDEDRIYTTGVSNGSMMSQRLACELPGVFAAVGAVSGPFRGEIADICDSSVSIIGIQGTDDPFFPMEDEDGIPELPRILKLNKVQQTVTNIEEIAQIWVAGNSCNDVPDKSTLPNVVDDGTSVIKYSYAGCTSGRDVVYYQVVGMGHGWPPKTGQAENIAGSPSLNINATDVIWEFFATHAR